MKVNLDELYVICRDNDSTVMHGGYEGVVGPKFYKKGYANEPCSTLNKRRHNGMGSFNPDVYDRKYFSEETIRGFAHRHAKNLLEENRMGPWVIRKASEVFSWK